MQHNTLQSPYVRENAKRVGRGGKRGKTSGRGTKGQKARAGHRMRPEMRDIIKKIPKRRGFGKNRGRTVNDGRLDTTAVSLLSLVLAFTDGEEVTPAALRAKGLVRRGKSIKILGSGKLDRKLIIKDCAVSLPARASIAEAGGSVA